MERAKTALATMRDTRRLLVERLPVAWDLLQDESVIFPTREQFLLNWLLDAAFRLLKGATSADRVRQLMEEASFWRLLLVLMGGGERPVRLGKPVLPLFITFIRTYQATTISVSDTSPDTPLALVKACMMRLVQEHADTVIARAPLRQVQELFTLPAQEVLLEERLYLLLAWQRRQSQQQQQQQQQQQLLLRLFHELGKIHIIPHMVLLRDPDGELSRQVIRELLINGEVIRELHQQLNKLEESSEMSEILLALRPLGAERLLKAVVANARDVLGMPEYRQLVLKLTKRLKEEGDLSSLTIVKQLVAASMASIQTDDSWTQTCALVTEIVESCPGDAGLLREIIDLDVALLLPHLPQVLQLVMAAGLEEEQIAFMRHLVRRQSETRQLDQLIMIMLGSIRAPLPVLLLTDWFHAPLAQLHVKVLRRIAADLLEILLEGAAATQERVNLLNVTRFLLTITKANVNAIMGDDLQEKICRLVREPRLEPAIRYGLCSVLEEAEGQVPGSIPGFHQEIVPLAEQLHHAGCSLLSLAQGKLSEVASWILSDQDACTRYLPTLLSKGIIPRMDNLPMAILSGSLLFWERLADVNAFIETYWDQPHVIEVLIRTLPSGIVLDERTVLRCLERFGAEYAEKILMAAPLGMQLATPQVKDLLKNGSESLGLIMFQRGWATAEDLLRRDISNRALIVILASLTEAQVRDLLSRTLAKFPTDDRYVHVALALLSRRVPNLYARLCQEYPLLTETQQWQLAASFHRHGQQSQVGLGLEDALRVYLNYDGQGQDPLTLKDVMQFIPMAVIGEGGGGGEKVEFSLSSEAHSLLQEGGSCHARWVRLVPLLDAFLTQSLVVQDAICPLVDTFVLTVNVNTAEFVQLLPAFGRLLHHRLLCGGANIGRLQQIPGLFDHILLLVSHLHCISDLISILGVLLKFHWSILQSRRPLLVAWLRHLIGRAGEAPRRVARLLADFATIRQADQHFYVGPLLLAACHEPLAAPVRAILTPALCLLIRHLDQQVSALKAEGLDQEKYFDADPLHRLMAQAETDDARVILKRLISTYMEEYKFTGKA